MGYYRNDGDELTVALGQSYRLDDNDNPFSEGSGFEQQKSDIVGQIGASFNNHRHNLNYRFQLDGDKLNSERHEVYGQTGIKDTRLSAIYLYERGTEGTEFEESREQIQTRITHDLDENWFITGAMLYDLGQEEGMRKASAGLGYNDDCFGVAMELNRELQREATGTDDLSVLVRFRLKNLGEFETTAYDGGSSDDDDDDENDVLNEGLSP